MTHLERRIRAEISASGPTPFRRFMRLALYDPEHGYYRRRQDPFGAAGDFFTAEQLQPVYGEMIARVIDSLREQLESSGEFRVVELGAGRGEMEPALSRFGYTAVDVDRGELPERFTGVVLANEFFDALPVNVAVRRGQGFRQLLVAERANALEWVEGGEPDSADALYLARHASGASEGQIVEIHIESLDWMERIAAAIDRGFLLLVDYGYTSRELARFPQGSLMSYRRHVASSDVLAAAGERDITSHVPFTALESHAERCGLRSVRSEPLVRTLMRVGELDGFAGVLRDGESDAEKRKLQLKTLLFGMGETFRTMLFEKESGGGHL